MAQIFISYAQADRERVAPAVRVLLERGWSVWWDIKIPAGRDWAEVIEEELDASQTVVVFWTSASIESEWVRLEARRGKAKLGGIVPLRLDPVEPPLEFSGRQYLDLIDWTGDEGHPGVVAAVDRLTEILGPGEARTENLPVPDRPAGTPTAFRVSGRVAHSYTRGLGLRGHESVMAGVVLNLVAHPSATGRMEASDVVVARTLTDAAGEYSFDNVPPGTYLVEAQQPINATVVRSLGSAGEVAIVTPVLHLDAADLTGASLGDVGWDFEAESAVGLGRTDFVHLFNTGTILVEVRRRDGPMQGGHVRVSRRGHAQASPHAVFGVTSAEGECLFSNLLEGVYEVSVSEEAEPWNAIDTDVAFVLGNNAVRSVQLRLPR